MHIHTDTHFYRCAHTLTHTQTLWHLERPLEPLRQKEAQTIDPFVADLSRGPRGWRGGRPQGQDPDPAPPGLRLRDTEVIVLCSPLPWRTPSSSGRTVGITREHLTNSHSEYFFHGGLVAQLCPTLATPWTVALQAPLSLEFSRQEHWSELPFPSPILLSRFPQFANTKIQSPFNGQERVI